MSRRSLLSQFSNRSPVPYVPPKKGSGYSGGLFGSGQGRPRYDSKSHMDAYANVGTLFAIVSRLANSTASVDWKLCKEAPTYSARQREREFDQREEVAKHAALDLWNKPNPFMTGSDFRETIQQHLDLTGEAWIVVSYTNIKGKRVTATGPLELWPMRPDRVHVVTDDKNFLTGYIYKLDGEEVPLKKEDVIRLRMPDPRDPYRGLGPVGAIMTDLDSQMYASEYNRNFFLNSAEPGGIIEIEDRLDDDEFRELASRWREQHQGVANAHRVAILEQGKWVDRRYTMQDMAFPELAMLNQEKIREAFGFPKAMLGGTEDVNKAVMEASERMFAKWLLVPRLDRIAEALNYQLLPMFGASGKGVEFEYENPVAPDRMADSQERFTKSQAVNLMVQAGFDAAETLEAFGLPPIKWTKPPEPKAAEGPSGQRTGPKSPTPDQADGSKPSTKKANP